MRGAMRATSLRIGSTSVGIEKPVAQELSLYRADS